jgi:hypothetical protein
VAQPAEIEVRIDRLVVETEHPFDGFALRLRLADAVRAVLAERGLPAAWDRDRGTPVSVIDDLGWDGRGGEAGLAHALAVGLYDGPLSAEVRR